MRSFLLTSILLTTLTTTLTRAHNFVLIAAPGSGKGTFCQYLVEKYDYTHICPGDIFRDEIRRQTELGKKIQTIVEAGEYVQEDIVCTLVADAIMSSIQQRKAFVVDGFPRSHYSLQSLHTFLQNNELAGTVRIVQCIANDALCTERVLTRQVCTLCFKVYNSNSAQPKNQGVCDVCGVALSRRAADTDAIIRKRLVYFHETIEPLLCDAEQLYKVVKIETEADLESLYLQYDNLIKEATCYE